MTKEELKEHCEKQVKACEMWAENRGQEPSGKVYEEHKLILELLEENEDFQKYIDTANHINSQLIQLIEKHKMNRPTSDDCVSRQAVLDTLMKCEKPCDDRQDFYLDSTTEFEEEIKELPPVTPTQCIAEVKFSKDDLREICNERIEIACKHGTCKKCKHRPQGLYCNRFMKFTNASFYCADFEKRDDENN